MSNRPRPLYVPDLSRPAGADVDAFGEVGCIACGQRVSVMDADVVGLGYRCARCSMLATPDDDIAASLAPSQQPPLRALPRRGSVAIAGLVLFAIAALCWRAGWDIELHDADGGESVVIWIVFAAIACVGIATRPRD